MYVHVGTVDVKLNTFQIVHARDWWTSSSDRFNPDKAMSIGSVAVGHITDQGNAIQRKNLPTAVRDRILVFYFIDNPSFSVSLA